MGQTWTSMDYEADRYIRSQKKEIGSFSFPSQSFDCAFNSGTASKMKGLCFRVSSHKHDKVHSEMNSTKYSYDFCKHWSYVQGTYVKVYWIFVLNWSVQQAWALSPSVIELHTIVPIWSLSFCVRKICHKFSFVYLNAFRNERKKLLFIPSWWVK